MYMYMYKYNIEHELFRAL